MIEKYLQIRTLNIVFIGNLNPSIIQPFWLANKGLIREIEAEKAKIDIIHDDIVKFELDWARFEITKNRFSATTVQEAYFEPLRDLVCDVFELLKETPLKAIGINHIFDLALQTSTEYFNLGNRLSPLSTWEKTLKSPKLLSIEIVDEERYDDMPGRYTIRIQPSEMKLRTKFGVMINMNDHFSMLDGKEDRDSHLVKRLKDGWTNSLEKSDLMLIEILKFITD